MGLFDFFKKNAGRELFKENDAAEAKAEAIRRELKRMGIDDEVKVRVEGNTVKLSGRVKDQATKEKLMLIAGNTRHVNAVDDEMQPAAGPATQAPAGPPRGASGTTGPVGNMPTGEAGSHSRFHTVESGDTLSKIAEEYYGDAGKYPVIFEANRPMLADPDEIYPGQVLRIPDEGRAGA